MHSIRYVSSTGKTVEMDGPVNYSGVAYDLRAGKWKYELAGRAVKGLSRAAREVEIEMLFLSLESADEAFSIFDADVQANASGTIWCKGWSQRCFIVAANPENKYQGNLSATLTAILLDGRWLKHSVTHFQVQDISEVDTDGLDYPTDYPYDYQMESATGSTISVDSPVGAMVGVTFFGACSSPYVRIGGNIYGVEAAIPTGSRIVVDPLGTHIEGGSVYSVGQWGERENLFDKRRRGASGSGSYIFERLPSGIHTVTWPQSLSLDIDIIKERGTPPWS